MLINCLRAGGVSGPCESAVEIKATNLRPFEFLSFNSQIEEQARFSVLFELHI